jgi:signal transduction histidine kinase
MPVTEKKNRILIFTFLVIFFVALVLTVVELVLDLVLVPVDGNRDSLVVTVGTITMLTAGSAVLAIVLKGREDHNNFCPLEDLAHGLAEASSLPDTAAQLAWFAHLVVPKSRTAVYALNPHSLQLEAQATCDREGRLALPPDLSWMANEDGDGQEMEFKLMNQERQAGILVLVCPPQVSPDEEQLRLLNLAVPLTALAIEGYILRLLSDEQARAIEKQRRRIAQDLHDSLAQNIGYLRLKLDQLTCQPLDPADGRLMQELEVLHATAEEAYVQVRSTLDELNPVPDEDLHETLRKQALVVSRRAGLHLRMHQIGAPFRMPPAVRHHILYVAREALFNIEKHARAAQVLVQLLWLENELILKITDDGVGFNYDQVPEEGHYGLWIMKYRVHEAGGNINITPGEEGRGTEVTLWIPRSKAALTQEPLFQFAGMPPASMPPASVPPASVPPASVPPASVPPATLPPSGLLPAAVLSADRSKNGIQPASVPVTGNSSANVAAKKHAHNVSQPNI